MASITEKVLLTKVWQPMLLFARNGSHRRVNLQRPRPPHYQRALLEALVKPKYPKPIENFLPLSRKCLKKEEAEIKAYRPDNPYENLLAEHLKQLFKESRLIAICHRNMFEKEEQFGINIRFKREGMILKNSSKHTLKIAIANTKYEPILQLFSLHQTIIFSAEPKVDLLLKILKKTPKLILMAGIVDGYFASVTHLNDYCRLQDLETARAELVSVLNLGAQRIFADLNQQQRLLVGQLDQHVAIHAGKSAPADSQQQNEGGNSAQADSHQQNEADGKSADSEKTDPTNEKPPSET